MSALRHSTRRGTVLPILAICLFGLFFFVAMAIDLGMVAVARTQCQNAADDSALIGCRNLNNAQPGNTTYNNNVTAAVQAAQNVVPLNNLLSANFTSAQVQSVTPGIYGYNSTSQTFSVSYPSSLSTGQSWTAIKTVVSVTQPTYFMRVFGVTSMPNGATAVAVHRPRDTAFVLDMTGSMRFASRFSYNGVSMNPDPVVPKFGHYNTVTSNLVATANTYIAAPDGEVISMNNFTMTTTGGPAIVQNFVWDPANATSPSTSAYPVTSNTSSLLNGFGRWSPPVLVAGNTTTTPPTPDTYDFTGYDPTNIGTESSPKGPTPAPYNFQTMTDSTSPAITYCGDRYRRLGGVINKADTTWTGTTYGAATCDIDLLGYNVNGSNVQVGTSGTTVIAPINQFRDPVWETYGYDLNIPKYITWRNTYNAGQPAAASTYLAASTANGGGGGVLANIQVTQSTATPSWNGGDNFKGFSMGPGYWGKTFFIWPPDPRWGGGSGSPDPTNLSTTSTVKDANGNWICDWRRRFFLDANNNPFTAQSTSAVAGINASMLSNTTGNFTINSAGGFTPNYAMPNYKAILAWLKTGPMVLPPNLRGGRILYYSSIPTDVTGGSGQVALDQVFWQNYIDYVLGTGNTFSSNDSSGNFANLYGYSDSWSANPVNIYSGNLTPWSGPTGAQAWPTPNTATTPYMAYNDSPLRPRLHMWFGPLSMMDFIATCQYNQGYYQNWTPGTAYEAQCWQLKAGMNSVLSDLQQNHPNDMVGMAMFAFNSQAPPTTYQTPRVGIGQNFIGLKNALFYPTTLQSAINGGDLTSEIRPHDINFTTVAPDVIPNASCGTDPNTGLALAFNLLSPSTLLPTSSYGTIQGRKGASKLVIFETDGVPNCYTTYTFNQQGYNSYYSNFANGAVPGNGSTLATNPAVAVVTQMAKPMATTASSGTDSGLSLGNATVKVYPIAFGDIFDPVAAPNATYRPTALQFLANIASAGNTGASGATTIPSTQIITGAYATRIANLKTCLSQIFQSGVSVTLVQ